MQDKKLLQIGEVAKIFHVSMGTLRHYEQEGLLEPEYVDEKTGYGIAVIFYIENYCTDVFYRKKIKFDTIREN